MSPDMVFLNNLLCCFLFQGSVRVNFNFFSFFFSVYKENLRDSEVFLRRAAMSPKNTSGKKY